MYLKRNNGSIGGYIKKYVITTHIKFQSQESIQQTLNAKNYPRGCRGIDLFGFLVFNVYKLVFSAQSYKKYSVNYLEAMYIMYTCK